MVRGVQARRREGRVPVLNVAMAQTAIVQVVKAKYASERDRSKAGKAAFAIIDPSHYMMLEKTDPKRVPHLATLAERHLILHSIVGATGCGDGQCTVQQLTKLWSAVLGSVSLTFPLAVGQPAMAKMLASKYSMMLLDLRFFASRQATLLKPLHGQPTQTKDRVCGLVLW